jgi:hypothetical protein
VPAEFQGSDKQRVMPVFELSDIDIARVRYRYYINAMADGDTRFRLSSRA